jgi:hypothetical protein
MDPAPDSALFVTNTSTGDLQGVTKKQFSLSLLLLFEGTVRYIYNYSSEIKSHKEVTKQKKSRLFFLTIFA